MRDTPLLSREQAKAITDLEPLVPEADGVIRVNSTTNTELATLIEERAIWSYGLHDDADEDGELSATELAAPVASY